MSSRRLRAIEGCSRIRPGFAARGLCRLCRYLPRSTKHRACEVVSPDYHFQLPTPPLCSRARVFPTGCGSISGEERNAPSEIAINTKIFRTRAAAIAVNVQH